ncbi:MAG: hypothetical protein LBP62_04550 [Clostridiales bacterium]|jgi:hypothetical protein|nr:hypothetical protein [Clostridiales bacterium]
MIKKIENEIIKATCSKALQRAIRAAKFRVSDFDLLILAYKHAPDFAARLDLIKLIQENTGDKPTRAQAKRCIGFEKAKYELFRSGEQDCVFEVKIKDEPNALEERYLAKTYDGALKKIRFFCKHYKFVKFNENTRIIIEKRLVSDEKSVKEFGEDHRGEARFKGKVVLDKIDHKKMNEYTLLNKPDCKRKCTDCNARCFIYKAPELPPFLKNFDVVRYEGDYYGGGNNFSIVLITEDTGNTKDDGDDCAYCIEINPDILDREIDTDEKFFEALFNAHEHIEYPRLETVAADVLPEKTKAAYEKIMSLFERFGNPYL